MKLICVPSYYLKVWTGVNETLLPSYDLSRESLGKQNGHIVKNEEKPFSLVSLFKKQRRYGWLFKIVQDIQSVTNRER